MRGKRLDVVTSEKCLVGVLPYGISYCVAVSEAKVLPSTKRAGNPLAVMSSRRTVFHWSGGKVETRPDLEREAAAKRRSGRPRKTRWDRSRIHGSHYPAGKGLCSLAGAVLAWSSNSMMNSHCRRDDGDALSDLPILQQEGATCPLVEEGGGVDTPLKM